MLGDIQNQNQNNDKNEENLNLEQIFTTAIQTNQDNLKNFENEVTGSLSNEIKEFEDKIAAEKKSEEDLISQIKEQFIRDWINI